MRTWEYATTIAGTMLFAGASLVAQVTPPTPGSGDFGNLPSVIGTGGALSLASWLIWHMVTKMLPRQDERLDLALKASRDDHTLARQDYLKEASVARGEYLKQIDAQRDLVQTTMDRLADSVEALTASIKSKP